MTSTPDRMTVVTVELALPKSIANAMPLVTQGAGCERV
jgi:hypothetical protein